MQLGLASVGTFDAIYLSYSHTSSEFLYYDKDRLKTYRLGGQYNFIEKPRMGLQLEFGIVDYEGSRRDFTGPNNRKREGKGPSIAASWVIAVSDTISFRAGLDFNYVDKNDTYLPYSLATTFSSGIAFSF